MGKLYVKCPEPCIYDDQNGHVVDMSITEFYGCKRFRYLDENGDEQEKVREANPDKVFEVTDDKYWLEKVTRKLLIQVPAYEVKGEVASTAVEPPRRGRKRVEVVDA
ncbi:hypothetical protein [Neomegalonema sp.]|uniref:hypothetical protein n=1 Tax=Neomegalonema sp. TaxID=2039713 RepID=UPI002629399D|nr:hypothetical protein [Neomegalonema sp.]MDD2869675.1 hypothetical protein [Neomegalonema sp.]